MKLLAGGSIWSAAGFSGATCRRGTIRRGQGDDRTEPPAVGKRKASRRGRTSPRCRSRLAKIAPADANAACRLSSRSRPTLRRVGSIRSRGCRASCTASSSGSTRRPHSGRIAGSASIRNAGPRRAGGDGFLGSADVRHAGRAVRRAASARCARRSDRGRGDDRAVCRSDRARQLVAAARSHAEVEFLLAWPHDGIAFARRGAARLSRPTVSGCGGSVARAGFQDQPAWGPAVRRQRPRSTKCRCMCMPWLPSEFSRRRPPVSRCIFCARETSIVRLERSTPESAWCQMVDEAMRAALPNRRPCADSPDSITVHRESRLGGLSPWQAMPIIGRV